MRRTCQETLRSFRHSPATLAIFEHGKMLICNRQHQIFGVCNWLYRNSRRPIKSIDPQRLDYSSQHSWTNNFSWFRKFLSTIHTWLQPHYMAFESVDERKWEKCLQMDTNTTTIFWQNKNKKIYFTSTCVIRSTSALWDWDRCIRLFPRCSDHSFRSPNRISFREFQWHY